MKRMVSKDKILKRLQEHWNFLLQQGYDEDHILGIFVYGSVNYGYANENSDIDTKAIILPTFEQFCLNPQMISIEYHIDEEHIEIKDIRLMRDMWMKQNINFIEILYTDYFIINEKYKELFDKYFIQNREAIAHYDKQKTLKSISGQLLHTLHQEPTDNKKLYNASRLYTFLKDYFNEKSYAECLQPKDESLWELKYGESALSKDAEAKLVRALELEQLTNELVNKYAEVQSPRHDEATAALNEGVMEILKASFRPEINASTITKKEFFSNLTTTETKAYYAIISQIHDKGNITISDMVEKTSISRPVYANLLSKLKQYDVAKVVNRGSGGTDIEITQIELKNEAIDFT